MGVWGATIGVSIDIAMVVDRVIEFDFSCGNFGSVLRSRRGTRQF
jgi:hypothetical protein